MIPKISKDRVWTCTAKRCTATKWICNIWIISRHPGNWIKYLMSSSAATLRGNGLTCSVIHLINCILIIFFVIIIFDEAKHILIIKTWISIRSWSSKVILRYIAYALNIIISFGISSFTEHWENRFSLRLNYLIYSFVWVFSIHIYPNHLHNLFFILALYTIFFGHVLHLNYQYTLHYLKEHLD